MFTKKSLLSEADLLDFKLRFSFCHKLLIITFYKQIYKKNYSEENRITNYYY